MSPRDAVRAAWAPLAALALCPALALLAPGDPGAALAHVADIASAEHALGLFVEPAVHGWAAGHAWLLDAACVFYLWAHLPLTAAVLGWVRLRRPAEWPRSRDLFVATQLAVVAGWLAFPTAPPSHLPGAGLRDTTAAFWGDGAARGAHLLQSPWAAMPSGHVAWALVVSLLGATLAAHRTIRVLSALYAPFVVVVTVVTANHLLLDAAGAVAALAAGAVVAAAASRVRIVEATPVRPLWLVALVRSRLV